MPVETGSSQEDNRRLKFSQPCLFAYSTRALLGGRRLAASEEADHHRDGPPERSVLHARIFRARIQGFLQSRVERLEDALRASISREMCNRCAT